MFNESFKELQKEFVKIFVETFKEDGEIIAGFLDVMFQIVFVVFLTQL